MIKARLVLLAVFATTVYVAFQIFTWDLSWAANSLGLRVTFCVIDALFGFSAASLFVATFSKITRNQDETLSYNPESRFWKLLARMMVDPKRTSICEAFWSMVILSFMTAMMTGTVIMAILAIVQGKVRSVNWGELGTMLIYLLPMFTLMIITIAAAETHKRYRWRVLGSGGVMLLLSFAFMISREEHGSYLAAASAVFGVVAA